VPALVHGVALRGAPAWKYGFNLPRLASFPLIVAVRFVINVSLRMSYTFLPAFALGSGLSLEATSTTLSARELTALSAPRIGRTSDRIGPMTVMTWGGLAAAVGLMVATFGATGFVIGMIVLGFGRTAHQVAMNAWVGHHVRFENRGQVTGLIELTWGGAALVGLPIVGLLIELSDWRVPLGLLALGAFGFTLRFRHHRRAEAKEVAVQSGKPNMTRGAVGAIATNAAMTGAAQFLFLGHGLWLKDTYGLDTAEIGFAVLAVGFVEVIATLGSSRLTDRLGKRRSVLAGLIIMIAMMAALAIEASPPLSVGLAMLVVAFLGFEFGIVSAIPLISELDPDARAQMVGRAYSVSTMIRAIVTLIATAIYISQGFALMMAVAAVTGLVALALAALVMVEPGRPVGSGGDCLQSVL